jgi:hypothetical protein
MTGNVLVEDIDVLALLKLFDLTKYSGGGEEALPQISAMFWCRLGCY